jgi:hypothetical protein
MDDKRITLTAPKMESSSNYHYGELMMQVKEIRKQWTQIQEDQSWKMDSRETDIFIRQRIQIKSSVDDNMEFIMLKCSLINIHVHHEYKPYNKMTTPSIKYRQCQSL